MAFLVDTNVVSASAPTKLRTAGLIEWMEENSDHLYLSAITAAEIEDGIAKARREGARRKAKQLSDWLEIVLHLYAPRILPFDLEAARVAGQLSDLARAKGHAPGFPDLAIAAIAKTKNLTILTHNEKHFIPLGVAAYDPFQSLPD